MSRRFKLSHELPNIKNSMDGIPEMNQIEMDQDKEITSQSNQKQDLESFLQERLEESNNIVENLKPKTKSFQNDENEELEEKSVL